MGVELPQLLAVVRVVGSKIAAAAAVEEQAGGRREHAAVEGRGQPVLPDLLAGERVEGDQESLVFRPRAGLVLELLAVGAGGDAEAQPPLADRVGAGLNELLGQGVEVRVVVVVEVHDAPALIPGHRLPVVGAGVRGRDPLGLLLEDHVRVLDRPAGFHVDVGRPVDRVGVGMGAEEFAGLAVDDVEEAVLRRLQEHLPLYAVDGQLAERDVHRRAVVPVVAGDGLVVPLHLGGVGVDRHDRGQEQVVAAAR